MISRGRSNFSIHLATTLDETHEALSVGRRIWGEDSIRDFDVYFVAATHGGYLATARVDGRPVGMSFGMLSDGGRGLHSRMTGVIPEAAGEGVGLQLKLHQRAWAAGKGIDAITWTFDPLVRRNAWFNLVRLGATVTDYRVNYYGALGDAINGDDETDRLHVSWLVDDSPGPVELRTVEAQPTDVVVSTPADVETIRLNGLQEGGRSSREWRLHMRTELFDRMQDNWALIGFTSGYDYVLRQL